MCRAIIPTNGSTFSQIFQLILSQPQRRVEECVVFTNSTTHMVSVPQNTENGTHTHTYARAHVNRDVLLPGAHTDNRANSSNLISTYSSQGFSRWVPKELQSFALSSNSAKVTDEKKQKERLGFRCARGKPWGKTNNLERLPCACYMRGPRKERKRNQIQKQQLQWNTCKLS